MLGLDDEHPAVSTPAGGPHDSVHLVLRLEFPTEVLVDPHAFGQHVDAVPEVVEHLSLGRQVRAVLAEGPLDVAGGEHRMRLVEAHI